MAIQIGGTTVIDNSRNYVAISSVSTGIAGTQTWNSGQSSINIDGTTGNIKIDGILKAGNIIIPDMGDDRSLIAEVIAVSDTFNWHKGEFVPTDLKVGMRGTIPPLGSQKIKIDNVDYLIMAQNNIPAIIED